MAVRSHDLEERQDIRWNKFIALGIWSIGVITTYLIVSQLGLPGIAGIVVAILVQLVLTRLESPAWRGDRNIVAYAAVALDTLINIGGTWSVIKPLHQTAPIQALGEMFGANAGPVTGVVAFATCVILGLLLAAAPESIWND